MTMCKRCTALCAHHFEATMKITVRMREKKFVLPIGLDIRLIYIDRDVEDSNLKDVLCAFKWKLNRISKIPIIY
jgi:hypothetical protein